MAEQAMVGQRGSREMRKVGKSWGSSHHKDLPQSSLKHISFYKCKIAPRVVLLFSCLFSLLYLIYNSTGGSVLHKKEDQACPHAQKHPHAILHPRSRGGPKSCRTLHCKTQPCRKQFMSWPCPPGNWNPRPEVEGTLMKYCFCFPPQLDVIKKSLPQKKKKSFLPSP